MIAFIAFSMTATAQWSLQSNPLSSGDTTMLGKIQFVSATEGWIASGNDGSLLHTVNGGTTWNIVTPFPSDAVGNMSDPALSMSWVNPTHGWALKTFGSMNNSNGVVLYNTVNGGTTWNRNVFPNSVTTISYTKADLQGTWRMSELIAANIGNTSTTPVTTQRKSKSSSSSWAGWIHGILTLDVNGNGTTSSVVKSDGTTETPSSFSMNISTGGNVTINGDFNGFMSSDKSTVYFTMSDGGGGYALAVMQKQTQVTTFNIADLQGTWQLHSLKTYNPSNSNQNAGWLYGTVTLDGTGNGSISMTRNDGTDSQNLTMSVTSDGIITMNGTDFYGYMSADKKTVTITMTDNGGTYELMVMQKVISGTVFTTSNLQGRWQTHVLTTTQSSNSGLNQQSGWSHGIIALNANGTGTADLVNSNDNKSSDPNNTNNNTNNNNDESGNAVSLTISSSGTVTSVGSDLNGTLSADKNTILMTKSEDNGGYSLIVMQKDLSLSGDFGLQVQFADQNTGWVSIYNMISGNFQIYKTTNGGSTWNILNTNAGGIYYFVDASNGWMEGSSGNIAGGSLNSIYHTTNGGSTWTLQASNIGTTKAIYFSDLQHGWVVGQDGLVLKTIDGGSNWNALTNTGLTTGYNTKAVFFLDANNGWISGGNENSEGVGTRFILATKDGGTTWTTQPTPVTNDIFSIFFWDVNTGWLTSDYGQIAHYTSPKTINTQAGGLSAAITQADKNSLTSISITGIIDARDFKTLRDEMPLIANIDLSGTTIAAYTGTEGTYGTGSVVYPVNSIPQGAFYNLTTRSGKATLNFFIFPSGVTTVGPSAFNATGLISIQIPSSVTSIGTGGFYGCSNLRNVSFGASSLLNSIGNSAFGFCSQLSDFEIPSSVSYLEDKVFTGSQAFISVNSGNAWFSAQDGLLYNKDMTKLLYCPSMKSGSYNIPSNVTDIAIDAFYNCNQLNSLTLPPSLTKIEQGAFYNCSVLSNISIPASVNTIGSYAFFNCNGLQSLHANAATPVSFSLTDSVFTNVNKNNCILFVPTGSKVLYQAANLWKDFTNINEEGSFLTYNVTVPAGTKDCFIGGDMNNWNLQEMTRMDSTHYSMNIIGAQQNQMYKYSSGPGWSFVELNADGGKISNRSYSVSDVVAKWTTIYDPSPKNMTYSVTVPVGTKSCYLTGVMNNWNFMQMAKLDNTHYSITIPSSSNYAYKFCSGPSMNYVEVNANGSNDSNRFFSANDVVERWLAVFDPSSLTAADYYLPLCVGNFSQLHTQNIPSGSVWGTRTTYYSFIRSENINGIPYLVEQGKEIMDNGQNNVNIFRIFWLRKDNSGNIVAGAYSTSGNDNLNSAVILNTPAMIFPNQYLNAGYSQTFTTGDNQTETDSIISVTSAAGSFTNCIQVREINKTNGNIELIEDTYYALYFGRVMQNRLFPVPESHTDFLVNSITNSVTGLNVLKNNDNLIMYPNPATDGFYLNTGEKTCIVTIYNLSGVMTYKKQITKNEYINISELPKGVYLVKIETPEGTVDNKLVRK